MAAVFFDAINIALRANGPFRLTSSGLARSSGTRPHCNRWCFAL